LWPSSPHARCHPAVLGRAFTGRLLALGVPPACAAVACSTTVTAGGRRGGRAAAGDWSPPHSALLAAGCPAALRFRRALLPPPLRRWALSSCYGALELVADLEVALGSDALVQANSLEACLEVVAAVSPGSDLHVMLAARAAGAAASAYGHDSAKSAAAARACAAAHRIRYGHISDELVARLACTNAGLV
jgi:hypothetical protein